MIGTRCWAPFEFEIPQEYYGGTHTLSVEITTSIMPLMGEYPKLEKEQPYADWVDIRSTAAIHPGLMQKPILKTRS